MFRLVIFATALVLSTLAISAQPSDWQVNASAFEFSMTVTFTVSVDGFIGGANNDVAGIFDDQGVCRGLGTANYYAATGYYTGLMLVYGNQAIEGDLEVRIYDASADDTPACDNTIGFVANGLLGTLLQPEIFYAVYDPLTGCTDPGACNFLPTAVNDNGTCIFPGCTEPEACNYEALPPCVDNNNCSFPEFAYDCNGDCLGDFDGDGICDELEIGGCTDALACNFSATATDDDCSCAYPLYPTDCNGDCYIDTDGDGVCDGAEIAGCNDPVGCNFNDDATDDDGSCIYCCYSILGSEAGFSLDVVELELSIEGHRSYQIFVTASLASDRVIGVRGADGTSTLVSTAGQFHQALDGGLLVTEIDPVDFLSSAEVALDSWLTIGLVDPVLGADEMAPVATAGLWQTQFNLGGDLALGANSNDGWSVDPTAANALAGSTLRVLVGQFTATAPISGALNIQVLPADSAIDATPLSLNLIFEAPPCGCMDASACNFDPTATYDDGSCDFPLDGFDCAGGCAADADQDGVCDEDEIVGCTDANADNYAASATDDDGSCYFLGCTYPDADNYDQSSTRDDGSCTFTIAIDNPCPTDLNGDGSTGAPDILNMLSAYGTNCD
jgi:hypothetical protein